jgi:hypothetical protein
MRRTSLSPSRIVRRSLSVERKFWRMRTGARGSAEASVISPRLSGRSITARSENPSA